MKHRQPALAAAALSALVVLSGCSSEPSRPPTAATSGANPSSSAPAQSATSSPTASPTGPSSAAPPPASATSSPAGPAPAADPVASGVNYGDPVAVAAAFTVAYYSYDWQQPQTLDPAVRAAPYTTDAYVRTLAPLRSAFPAQTTRAQETSVATIRSAALDADAPSPSANDAFATVSYSQHLTDHGTVTDNRSAWSLHLVRVGGAWRVDMVVARG